LVNPVVMSLEVESQTIESNTDSLASCIRESLGSEIRVCGYSWISFDWIGSMLKMESWQSRRNF